MQPIGILMKEHRLIERMIKLLEKELQDSQKTLEVDTEFLTIIIDFFTTYADKTHHGKEEDILFKGLSKKSPSNELKKTMTQLIQDHQTSRATIQKLNDATTQYKNGFHASINEIHKKMHDLIQLYPRHIEIEDKHFFFPAMDLFTRVECDTMLQEFNEFDKTLIHMYYASIVENQEKKYRQISSKEVYL
jgi:hemerythrin-like domain-containing protein